MKIDKLGIYRDTLGNLYNITGVNAAKDFDENDEKTGYTIAGIAIESGDIFYWTKAGSYFEDDLSSTFNLIEYINPREHPEEYL